MSNIAANAATDGQALEKSASDSTGGFLLFKENESGTVDLANDTLGSFAVVCEYYVAQF